jgi:hypothetical protein
MLYDLSYSVSLSSSFDYIPSFSLSLSNDSFDILSSKADLSTIIVAWVGPLRYLISPHSLSPFSPTHSRTLSYLHLCRASGVLTREEMGSLFSNVEYMQHGVMSLLAEMKEKKEKGTLESEIGTGNQISVHNEAKRLLSECEREKGMESRERKRIRKCVCVCVCARCVVLTRCSPAGSIFLNRVDDIEGFYTVYCLNFENGLSLSLSLLCFFLFFIFSIFVF